MATSICVPARKKELPSPLGRLLPQRLLREISEVSCARIEEIRLRRGRRASLTTDRGNLLLRTVLSGEEMESLLYAMCEGSLYAYRENICQGYLPLGEGIRVGICGRASVEDGRILGVYGVSGMNIRLPYDTVSVGEPICRLLREGGGVLVYAPPGVGKTTLLRSVALRMATGEKAIRVCLVDTRGELAPQRDAPSALLDILTGYPRGQGIAIAARTMSAQLMVCDELGELAEAMAVIEAQNCGVPLLASAHGSSLRGLLYRPALRRLHEAHVFSYYVGLVRCEGGMDYRYTVHSFEEAEQIASSFGDSSFGG